MRQLGVCRLRTREYEVELSPTFEPEPSERAEGADEAPGVTPDDPYEDPDLYPDGQVPRLVTVDAAS
jgi:hypothetical protein